MEYLLCILFFTGLGCFVLGLILGSGYKSDYAEFLVRRIQELIEENEELKKDTSDWWKDN